MVVWGGQKDGAPLADGARYDPLTDTWTATAGTSAPGERAGHAAVWTGTKMLVWGGFNAATKFYTVYSGSSAAHHDLRIAHVGYDRTHTTAEDSNTWFPLRELRRAGAAGRIAEVTPRFHGAPTNRSHRVTLEQDCPELLARLREDKADAAVLVAV